jgi:hypothetical protein
MDFGKPSLWTSQGQYNKESVELQNRGASSRPRVAEPRCEVEEPPVKPRGEGGQGVGLITRL